MITPEKRDFLLHRNCTWEYTYKVVDDAGQPVDLSGCTGELLVKKSPSDTSSLVSASYVVDGPAGLIQFTIPPSATLYDVWTEAGYRARLLWSGGKIDALGYGTFKLVK